MDANKPERDKVGEDAPTPPDKPRRRIVSRSQHLLLRSVRSVLTTSGRLFVYYAGTASAAVMWAFVMRFTLGRHGVTDFALGTGIFVIGGLLAHVVYLGLKHLGNALDKGGSSLDVGTPLTNSIAYELPAEEVLVRGAEKPEQAQSDVLLRATNGQTETPAEQLLRPGA